MSIGLEIKRKPHGHRRGAFAFSKGNRNLPHRLANVRHLALDLDGTLYLGKRLFPFTPPFLRDVAALGIGRTFFTNNSSLSTRGYVEKLRNLGIDCADGDVYSSTTATLAYLRERHPDVRRLFVLGTPALREEFADNGYVVTEAIDGQPDPQAIIVGFDTSLKYPRLCRAAYWICQGLPFLATNCDRICPTDQPRVVLPDCAAICKLLACATGREPDAVLGKPSPAMLGGVLRRHGLAPRHVAVVGDRLYTDVAMAQAAGAVSVLVLSGESTRAEVEGAQNPPDFICENVAELAALLRTARRSPTCQTA